MKPRLLEAVLDDFGVRGEIVIGYNRAARIVERMEAEGVVSRANHVGRREVLVGDIADDWHD